MTLNLNVLRVVALLICLKALVSLSVAVWGNTALPPEILGGLALLWFLGGLLLFWLVRYAGRRSADLSVSFLQTPERPAAKPETPAPQAVESDSPYSAEPG